LRRACFFAVFFAIGVLLSRTLRKPRYDRGVNEVYDL
jgi:hypothetical protein